MENMTYEKTFDCALLVDFDYSGKKYGSTNTTYLLHEPACLTYSERRQNFFGYRLDHNGNSIYEARSSESKHTEFIDCSVLCNYDYQVKRIDQDKYNSPYKLTLSKKVEPGTFGHLLQRYVDFEGSQYNFNSYNLYGIRGCLLTIIRYRLPEIIRYESIACSDNNRFSRNDKADISDFLYKFDIKD